MPGIVAMLSTMLLGLGALVSLPSSAHAAEVNVVKSIEMKNLYNKDGATKTKLWDTFRVNFTVDTTGTGAKAGDTFTVKLPDSLRTNVTSFPMYAKDGKTEVAKCEVPGGDGQTLTCTFGDYITSHPDMTGGGWVQAAVSKHKDVKKFTFMVPGGQISKDVPGGYVDPGRPRDLPKKAATDGPRPRSARASCTGPSRSTPRESPGSRTWTSSTSSTPPTAATSSMTTPGVRPDC